jgi:hypothetical protein
MTSSCLSMWSRPIVCMIAAALAFNACAAKPVVTQTLYIDRSTWITLETNPYVLDENAGASNDSVSAPSPAMLAALLKGFTTEKDYNVGVIGMAMGKAGYAQAFVQPEISMLSAQLAKGLAKVSSNERVGYCLTVDRSPTERFITTGWAYIRKSHLHFKLTEYRTPIRVSSPIAPTSEACQSKPVPGTKTADRFFKLDYEPKTLLVTDHGILGKDIFNGRGEVVFQLDRLTTSSVVKTPEAMTRKDDGLSPGITSTTEQTRHSEQPGYTETKDTALSPAATEKLQQYYDSSRRKTSELKAGPKPPRQVDAGGSEIGPHLVGP